MDEQIGVISFERTKVSGDGYLYFAQETHFSDSEIARHLDGSDKLATEKQIYALQTALNGGRVQEHWGEVMGSSLFIYQSEGTVEVGNDGRRISIQEFKKLLEDWLAFISQ